MSQRTLFPPPSKMLLALPMILLVFWKPIVQTWWFCFYYHLSFLWATGSRIWAFSWCFYSFMFCCLKNKCVDSEAVMTKPLDNSHRAHLLSTCYIPGSGLAFILPHLTSVGFLSTFGPLPAGVPSDPGPIRDSHEDPLKAMKGGLKSWEVQREQPAPETPSTNGKWLQTLSPLGMPNAAGVLMTWLLQVTPFLLCP